MPLIRPIGNIVENRPCTHLLLVDENTAIFALTVASQLLSLEGNKLKGIAKKDILLCKTVEIVVKLRTIFDYILKTNAANNKGLHTETEQLSQFNRTG